MVITTGQLYSTKPEFRFCAGSNPICGVWEIRDGESLWLTGLVLAGNKTKWFSSVNHNTKMIHHHHHYNYHHHHYHHYHCHHQIFYIKMIKMRKIHYNLVFSNDFVILTPLSTESSRYGSYICLKNKKDQYFWKQVTISF